MSTRRPIAVSEPDLSDLERRYLLEAFDSSWISSKGRFVSEFEARFAGFVGVSHAVSCTNGTSALHLALLALSAGPGDEVIVPDLTYVSTANAVRYVGAEPVFADCDPDTWTLAPGSVRRLLSARTKAIVAVHLLGVPADLTALRRIADGAGCHLVEDAAETPGARWAGKRVGSVGDVATFSFYGNKMISTGEGGMLCTDHSHLAARVRKLKGQGADSGRHYWFDEIGYNYRMTNPSCAIGLAQLERYGEICTKRSEVRAWYERALDGFQTSIDLQRCPDDATPAWWIVGALLAESVAARRDDVREHMERAGIETRPLFPALSSLPIYEGCRTDGGCPVARRLGRRGIMLPTHTGLSRGDIHYVVETMMAAIHQPVDVV